MERGYHVAIVGATGAVGLELLSILEERKFPIIHLALSSLEALSRSKTHLCGGRLAGARAHREGL